MFDMTSEKDKINIYKNQKKGGGGARRLKERQWE